jgi:ketosteroid isomerase-like protein
MSRENVEIVRQAIECFNRGDLDAAARYSDPEVEVDWSRSRGLEAGIYCGRQAARDFWNTFLDMFHQITVIPDEFIEVRDHVVVPNSTLLCGRDGIEVVARSATVVTVRHGRIVEWTLYQEKAEALEAVGLRE